MFLDLEDDKVKVKLPTTVEKLKLPCVTGFRQTKRRFIKIDRTVKTRLSSLNTIEKSKMGSDEEIKNDQPNRLAHDKTKGVSPNFR